jgi:hypothetical protein
MNAGLTFQIVAIYAEMAVGKARGNQNQRIHTVH